MSESKETLNPIAGIQQGADIGLDYALRVVNDVATTMTAVLDATNNMQKLG